VTARVAEVAAVREAGGRLADDLRAVRVIWHRELIRYLRNRTRIVTSLVQPVLFLVVLGTGLARAVPAGAGGVDFRTFIFPGVLAMTVLFTAVFSAVSIVWDREFGFLREMLVAPVRRGALVVGKCLGGATVATIQGAIMLLLAGLVHVPYRPALLATLVGEMALTAFALTAIGVLIASRMARIESFQVVIQFLVLPMFFLSGALFPLSGLPRWLAALTRVDPLSYAVDPLRRAVFSNLRVPAPLLHALDRGITWGGWRVPTAAELGLVALLAVAALAVAGVQFSRPE
jgi:ABC-2 type transport system permease protein